MGIGQLLAGFIASLIRGQRPNLPYRVLPQPVVPVTVHDGPGHRPGAANANPKSLQAMPDAHGPI